MAGRRKQAPKAQAPKKAPKAGGAPVRDRIVRSALSLAATLGWDVVTLADIAGEAGLSLADLRAEIDEKSDVLDIYARALDRRLLADFADMDEALSQRDRLFDILMARLEAMQADRAALISILRAMRRDPPQLVLTLPHLLRSMNWMANAARVDTSGWRGAARVMGLAALYARALCAWMDDDTPTLDRTMKALDAGLTQVFSLSDRFGL